MSLSILPVEGPETREDTLPLCRKCGRSFSIQEAAAGFTTCEFCGEGGAV